MENGGGFLEVGNVHVGKDMNLKTTKVSENPQGARSGAVRNPKRMQRAIQKQLQTRGPSTKAQQAMQLLREQGKESRLAARREQKEKEKEMRFSQRQEKRKQKHKGR